MDNKTVSEIKEYCRDNNITGYSKFQRKHELVDFVNQQMNNQHLPNQQIVSDAEFAAALLNSEREFYMKEQYEEIQKQKHHYEKQREEMLTKKKHEDDIKNKIIQETKFLQDQEYEKALQQDLENNMMEQQEEEIVEEKKPTFPEKISGDELEKMRMARLSRFG
mgnify:FL=1